MKKTVILTLIFSLVLIIGCSSSDYSGISDSSSTGSSSDNHLSEPTQSSDYLQNCLSIQDPMFMQMCSAVANHDIDMCDDVKNSDTNEQKYHQSMCRYWVAAANKNPEQCQSFKAGKEFLASEFTCLDFVAMAARDREVCEQISDQNGKNGCSYDVDVMLGKFDPSDCKDTFCVYDYAWKNQDKRACDKFGDVTTANIEMHRASCLAMLTGDSSLCNPLKSQGVDEWNFCDTKSDYRKMIIGGSNYDFSLCKKDDECIKTVMIDMILSMTR